MPDIKTYLTHIPKKQGDSRISHPYNALNPPIVRTSSVALHCENGDLSPTARQDDYGINGFEPHNSLKQAINIIENAYDTVLCNSGLEAVSLAILTNVKAGDHILVSDGVYVPTRHFVNDVLPRLGVSATYYNPDDTRDLDNLLQDNTTLLFAEFPSTSTMYMGDIDGILAVCKRHALISIVDNCWGAGVLFSPLSIGYDISIQAGTKYISGHSDVMLGTIAVREKSLFNHMNHITRRMGVSVSPDAVYLGLRGIRTIKHRLKIHAQNATHIMEWLDNHPLVDTILSPTQSHCVGHAHFKKHFTGHNGLFSFTFKDSVSLNQIDAFVNGLQYFIPAWGWGGFNSLISVIVAPPRTVPECTWTGVPIIRLHIGLEDTKDLINDLDTAIKTYCY